MADPVSNIPSVEYSEATGTLLHDATYLIRIPENWNGVLLNDLDYAGGNQAAPSRAFLLDQGYGLSGTSRLQTRGRPNLDNQLSVFDAVTTTFGAPRSIVQIGCSGGGAVALMMAEQHADRIHGVIAQCGTSPAMYRHIWTDQLFIAKALLAPESDAVVAGRHDPDAMPDADSADLPTWMEILEAAQATPLGRARIALIVALSQLPTWAGGIGGPTVERPPDPTDVEVVQNTMSETLTSAIKCAVAFAHGASAGHYSNTDVDFGTWYGNADSAQQLVVETLYGGLEGDGSAMLREDLVRLEATPRIHRDSGEDDPYWVRPNTGRPGVPTLHVTTMDTTTPPVVTAGYEARVRSEGLQEMYRSAYVERANHCGFSVSETAALVETLMNRLDEGDWPDTAAAGLNRRAAAFDVDDSRFVEHHPPRINRVL